MKKILVLGIIVIIFVLGVATRGQQTASEAPETNDLNVESVVSHMNDQEICIMQKQSYIPCILYVGAAEGAPTNLLQREVETIVSTEDEEFCITLIIK